MSVNLSQEQIDAMMISEASSRRDYSIKHDANKPRLSLIPTEALYAVAGVMEYGAKKYEKDGWKRVERERYVDAMYRHLLAEVADPGSMDEESGLPHLDHIGANFAILCGLREERSGVDG